MITFYLLTVKVKSLSCVRLFVTPWTVAHQAHDKQFPFWLLLLTHLFLYLCILLVFIECLFSGVVGLGASAMSPFSR